MCKYKTLEYTGLFSLHIEHPSHVLLSHIPLLYIFFYTLIWMYLEMMHRYCMDLLCEPIIYVSWSTSELTVKLVPLNKIKLSAGIFTNGSKAVLLLWILFIFYLCFMFGKSLLEPNKHTGSEVFVMLSCLFLAALRSPFTSWLSCVWCFLVCVCVFLLILPYGVPVQVWYLIVSI